MAMRWKKKRLLPMATATQPLRREREIELFYYGSFSLHLLIGRYVGYYLLCNLFSRAASHRQVRENFLLISSAALDLNERSACLASPFSPLEVALQKDGNRLDKSGNRLSKPIVEQGGTSHLRSIFMLFKRVSKRLRRWSETNVNRVASNTY